MTRTNILNSIAAVAMLAATASPAFAAKAQDPQAEAGTSASKGERKICKILETSGTMMTETKCFTEAGWKEYTARY
jgi:acid phosphatase class B